MEYLLYVQMDVPATRYALNGRTALVTGGGRSIGRGISIGLAHSGANVVVVYNQDIEAAKRTVADIERHGVRGLAIQADVGDPTAVARMLDEAEAAFGPVEIAVNNAGILNRTPFLEIPIDEFDRILRTNLRGYFIVAQAVARRMVRYQIKGRIINISSDSAFGAAPRLTHYSISKAGVTMLTKQMALELADYGILVNEVNPGLIETDINRDDIADPVFREQRLSGIPLKRIGTPMEIAGAVLFLASKDAGLMTGASVVVDGGFLIK